MSDRQSPTISATTQNVATIKTGNDGNKWIIMKTKSGTKRWIKIGNKVTKYKTHDNGGNPYYIIITNDKILVFKNDYQNEDNWQFCLVLKKYNKLFIGKNIKKYSSSPKYGSFSGNSILIEIKPLHYLFIGHEIKEFVTDENITNYYSTMGNNDVPYPFALSKNYVYLMLNNVYNKREKNDPEPYASYYKYKNDYKDKWKKFKSVKI